MENLITLTLIYPTKKITQKIRSIDIETDYGASTILPGHAPLYAALKENSSLHIMDETGTEEELSIHKALAWINRMEMRIIMSQQ